MGGRKVVGRVSLCRSDVTLSIVLTLSDPSQVGGDLATVHRISHQDPPSSVLPSIINTAPTAALHDCPPITVHHLPPKVNHPLAHARLAHAFSRSHIFNNLPCSIIRLRTDDGSRLDAGCPAAHV